MPLELESALDHMAVLIHELNANMSDGFSTEKTLRIYPANQQVYAHNKRVLEYFRSKNTEMFQITAQDQLVDVTRQLKNATLESFISNDINKNWRFAQRTGNLCWSKGHVTIQN